MEDKTLDINEKTNKKCPNCGANIISGNSFCYSCNTSINVNIKNEEIILEEKSDLDVFIDKNIDRYNKIFTKNQEKKVFISFNFAAFFLSFIWLMYRKMYKYAAIYLTISTILLLSLTVVASAFVKQDIENAKKILEPYATYMDETESLSSALIDGTVDGEELLKSLNQYKTEIYKSVGVAFFILLIPQIIFNLMLGLFADCLYRRYVYKNLGLKSGGTSGRAVVLAMVINVIVNNLVIEVIANKIINYYLG